LRADTARGIVLAPILSKFNSLKTSRKGVVAMAMVEYPSLEAATGKFSASNVLGVGGFGCVYKAVFDGGVAAAVKRLEAGGPECEKEFEVSVSQFFSIGHCRRVRRGWVGYLFLSLTTSGLWLLAE
jgi:hypothetical protein